ncbi:glycosyltransferase [Bowmanella denitrificans]|uniref:glycosyltransferase family protein n=1 Tax=Bowmanella denitrificans TaxID=366582 RepID=UPI0011AFBF85|nr:glycosyltransferase [Bowmanella denitrificans]
MTSFCIASPHKNSLWYDYRVYVNLREALEKLGFRYQSAAENRIYFLGAPMRQFYNEVGKFESGANNMALVYSHAEKLQSLRPFKRVFVSSQGVASFFKRRSWLRLDPLRRYPAFTSDAPIEIVPPFSSLQPSKSSLPRYECDLSFIGTPRIRPVLEDVLPIVGRHGLTLNLYGPNWDKYPGNSAAKQYWRAPQVPYEDIPLLAAGSKICLIDHHQTMNKMGLVSHKYVDLLMAGAFVISDYNLDALKHYGGVTYRHSNELESLILQYLDDDAERKARQMLQQSLIYRHSSEHAAQAISRHFV